MVMARQAVLAWVAVQLMGGQSLNAASVPVVNSVGELQALWDAAWQPAGPLDTLPPGTGACCRLLGPVVYSPSFETDFLDALPTRSQAGAIWRPLQIQETVTEPRHRICLNVHGLVVRTNEVPSGYEWMQAVRLGHGDPPPWLSAMELEAWWVARDPARQQVGCDLVSAAALPAYLAMLTAGVARVGNGSTNVSLSDLYRNELAFVSAERADSGMQVRIHAPVGAERLELFRTADPREPRAWVLSALIEHAAHPEIALARIGDAGLLWAAAEAGRIAMETDSRMHGRSCFTEHTPRRPIPMAMDLRTAKRSGVGVSMPPTRTRMATGSRTARRWSRDTVRSIPKKGPRPGSRLKGARCTRAPQISCSGSMGLMPSLLPSGSPWRGRSPEPPPLLPPCRSPWPALPTGSAPSMHNFGARARQTR
jgi:hypothetical protein